MTQRLTGRLPALQHPLGPLGPLGPLVPLVQWLDRATHKRPDMKDFSYCGEVDPQFYGHRITAVTTAFLVDDAGSSPKKIKKTKSVK